MNIICIFTPKIKLNMSKFTSDLGYEVFKISDTTPSVIGISSRQINYWIENKLVPFVEMQNSNTDTATNKSGAKWIRLNLGQVVWVGIIKELLKYRVPIPSLQKLTEDVWQKPRENHYADKVIKNHIDKNPDNLDKNKIEDLKSNLKDESLMEHYFRIVINPFNDMVKSAVFRECLPHAFLYAPNSNDHWIHLGSDDLVIELGSKFLQQTMFSISIQPILLNAMSVNFENTKNDYISYLTSVENQIRDIILFKKIKRVEIVYRNKEINPIIVTQDQKSRMALISHLLKNKIEEGTKLLMDIKTKDHYVITLM